MQPAMRSDSVSSALFQAHLMSLQVCPEAPERRDSRYLPGVLRLALASRSVALLWVAVPRHPRIGPALVVSLLRRIFWTVLAICLHASGPIHFLCGEGELCSSSCRVSMRQLPINSISL